MSPGKVSSRHVGVDTGGTFTDLVEVAGDGSVRFDKAFSTPAAPEEAILDVLRRVAGERGEELGAYLGATERLAHGTTVSTNALIQRRGARVGLLTTRGFEDTLEIARGPVGRTGGLPQSKAMDFLHTEAPPPLVPRRLVRGLGERVTVTGDVIAPVKEEEIEAALRALLGEGMESLAVCLLWAFRNPAHERRVREVAARVAPALPVSLSSEVAPTMGEFERTVTTVVNAFVGPVTERYIGSLQRQLQALGLRNPIQVMKSSGGLALPESVGRQSISVINSGPIGGLVAARYFGELLGHGRIITADMGGTSLDVGLIADGAFEEQASPFLDQGLPVSVPAIKVVTIGAGGGSIARTDGHRLSVGPESAGADPGPACYGRGGRHPTVTDSLVMLGIIDPDNFFGGRYALSRSAAEEAVGREIAGPLGLSPIEAAAGIFEVVTARMGDLIRKVTVESGWDPREFCLLAYGGATAAHCAVFARQLGVGKVVIPYAAPVFSALGIALSDVLYTHSRSLPLPLEESRETLAAMSRTLGELEAAVRAEMVQSGITDPAEVLVSFRLDLRYRGQMNEISLPWGAPAVRPEDVSRIREAFEAYYQKRFGAGTIRRASPLEIISFRADAVKAIAKPPIARLFEGPAPAAPEPRTRRRVYQHGAGWVDSAIYAFDELRPGPRFAGPAVIERNNTTVWLPPGATAALDEYGNLEISPGGDA